MSDKTQAIGNFDRAEETDEIRQNPPASVGDPAGGTVMDNLESLFEDTDEDHYETYEAKAPNGAILLLEFDTDLDPEEYERYQKVARGNRESRRKKGGDEDVKPWLSAAAMLAEKSTKITNKATGKVYQDARGRELTLNSEEWLALAKCPGDPINAMFSFFKFAQVVSLGNGYIEDTGLDDEVRRVDPTRA